MIELKPRNFWRTAIAAAIGQRGRLTAGLAVGGLILVNHPRLPEGSYFARAMKPAEYRAMMADEMSSCELLERLMFNHPDVMALGPEDWPAARELFFGLIVLGVMAAPGNVYVMDGAREEYHGV